MVWAQQAFPVDADNHVAGLEEWILTGLLKDTLHVIAFGPKTLLDQPA